MNQRIENVRAGIMDLSYQDWTGRSRNERGHQDAEAEALPAFSRLPEWPMEDGPTDLGPSDAPIPSVIDQDEDNDAETLVALRRMKLWEQRINRVLEKRIEGLESQSLDKEVKYRKLVSLCTKVSVDKVDGVSD